MRLLLIFVLLTLGLRAQQLEVTVTQRLEDGARVGWIKLSGQNVRCVAIRDVPRDWTLTVQNSGAGNVMLSGNAEHGVGFVEVRQLLAAIVFEKVDAKAVATVKLRMELLNPKTGDVLPDTEFAARLAEHRD